MHHAIRWRLDSSIQMLANIRQMQFVSATYLDCIEMTSTGKVGMKKRMGEMEHPGSHTN